MDWSQEKTALNVLIDKLCHIRDQLPSVHSDSVPVGEGVEMVEAQRHIREAIRHLEPLRKYKSLPK